MFKDRRFIWVLEYVIGLGLLAVIMPAIVRPHPGWSPAHGWAYLLFIACSGITLLSCAGSMRQRMHLEDRIKQLEQKAHNPGHARREEVSKEQHSEEEHKQTVGEQFINSLN
jgi:hypothetical protein